MTPKKAAALELGKELRFFIVRKWKTQSRAAKILDVKANALSMILNGHRAPTADFVSKMISFGFDEKHFKKFFDTEDINPEVLTKQELIDLIKHQKYLLERQQEVIEFLMKKKNKY